MFTFKVKFLLSRNGYVYVQYQAIWILIFDTGQAQI